MSQRKASRRKIASSSLTLSSPTSSPTSSTSASVAMSIENATASYELWLAKHVAINEADLAFKHERMANSPFEFLRATFYRWMQNWTVACADLASGSKILTVGDLHIENFGTWRDLDGRLVWGINDYDETSPQTRAIDLVRLATSAGIANRAGTLRVGEDDAFEAIYAGYERALMDGPKPFVLEEHHGWLRELATGEFREPDQFWARLQRLPTAKNSAALSKAKQVLFLSLPKGAKPTRLCTRVAGLGSLGRPRFVALADWGGSLACREAKAAAPSAALWAQGEKSSRVFATELIRVATRLPDPFYGLDRGWVVRRLAPHCSKIDLAHLPKRRDDLALLEAMGFEIANLHAGQKGLARKVSKAEKRAGREAVSRMTEITLEDWTHWRKLVKRGR